jgi:hypothetical protein
MVNHVVSFLYKYDKLYGYANYKMRNHPLPAQTEVNEIVELHFYSSSGPCCDLYSIFTIPFLLLMCNQSQILFHAVRPSDLPDLLLLESVSPTLISATESPFCRMCSG